MIWKRFERENICCSFLKPLCEIERRTNHPFQWSHFFSCELRTFASSNTLSLLVDQKTSAFPIFSWKNDSSPWKAWRSGESASCVAQKSQTGRSKKTELDLFCPSSTGWSELGGKERAEPSGSRGVSATGGPLGRSTDPLRLSVVLCLAGLNVGCSLQVL